MRRSFRVCATAALLCSALTVGRMREEDRRPPHRRRPRRHRLQRRSRPSPRRRRRQPRHRRPRRARRPKTRSSRKSTVDELNKQGLLADVVLRARLGRAQSGVARDDPEEHRLPEALDVHQDHGRRPRRLARHQRIQPRAGRAPRRRPSATTWSAWASPPTASPSSARVRKRRSAPRKARAAGSRTAAATSCSPRSNGQRRSAERISSAIRSAAARGSGAAMIGRPTTM